MWIVQPLQLKDSNGKPLDKWRLIARSDEDGGFHECCACKGGHDTAREAETCHSALERSVMITGLPQLTKKKEEKPKAEEYFEAVERGMDKTAESVTVPRAMVEQFCRDLNQAHDELLRAQGIPEDQWHDRDWPDWTPQANSIRGAEQLLGKPLSKSSLYGATPPECQVIINGRYCRTSRATLSYEEVLALAEVKTPGLLSMTYHSEAKQGILAPGDSTPVVPGMVFDFVGTGNA